MAISVFNRRGHVPFVSFIESAAISAIFFLGSPALLPASTYYLDPAGNNKNNGTSESTPWRDFTHVNSTTFVPGDKVLLKRGGTWNQHLQLHGSGTPDNFIEVGPYGTGARPKIQRDGNVADRCLTTYDVSYVKISGLEVCEAGAGIVVHYAKSYNHRAVYIDDVVAHGFYGIKTNQVPNPLIPDAYLHRGTNGWEGVVGSGHGPNPALVSYWAPDDVAFSYGIGLTGVWDMANNNTTMLDDFRVTNCEVYHAGCGVALDWNNHTNRDGYFAGEVKGWRSPRNKATNVLMDNLNIHDIDSPWVSLTGIFWTSGNNGILKNSIIYKGAYFASGGTAQLHWYLSNNCLIDNVQVRTSVLPNPTTTDLSIADIGGSDGLEIRHSTFENIAGYGMGFLYDPEAFPDVSVHNVNIHHNTFLNIDWHWPNIKEIFHAVGNVANHPTGTINNNKWIGAPDVVLVGGKVNHGDPADSNWDLTSRYANDVIDCVPSGSDLAAGKLATSSTVLGLGYEALRLTDSDESTRWASDHSGSPQWIRIDLGSVMPFNQVKIAWDSPTYAVKYEVRVSQDGRAFETVHNRDLKRDLGATTDIFTTRLARYVEVEMTAGNTAVDNPPNYSIWSIGVFNEENHAQGRPALASSTSASSHFGASKATDGDDASRWVSAVQTGAATFTIDLGSQCVVNEVKINWGSSFAKAYTIGLSADRSVYRTVSSRTGVESQSITRDIFPIAVGRYVLVTMTEGITKAPVDYSIAEIRIYGARNLAQDANASASSTRPTPGYDVQRAVDTSENTSWSSNDGNSAAWFKVDMGAPYPINEVITKWDSAYAKKYTVATSTDDVTYTTVSTHSDVRSPGTITDKFHTCTARYVKVTMTEGPSNGATYYSIKTILVNNDIARDATCSASTTDENYAPANAVDSSDDTQWTSLEQNGKQYFKVDFGSPRLVDEVITQWGTAFPFDYTVEVSDDDAHWVTVKTRHGISTSALIEDTFERPVTAQYIRLNMSKDRVANSAKFSIRSLKAYGPHP